MQYLGLYSRVLGLLKTEQKLAFALSLGALFLGFFQLAQVALFGWFVQALVDNHSPSAVLVVWVACALIAVAVALWVASQASRLAHRARLAAVTQFFERQIAASSGFSASTKDLPRMNEIMLRGADQMFFLLLSFFRTHLPALIIFALSVPLAFFACWQLALVLYAALACFAVINLYIIRRAFSGQTQIENFHARMRTRLADSMGKAMIVQSYGRLGAETEDLTRFMQELLGAEYPVLNWWTRRHALVLTSGSLLLAVMAAFALPFYTANSASIGDVVIFAGLAIVLTAVLWRVANAANLIFFESAPIRHFFALLDAQNAMNDDGDAPELQARTGQIAFDGVSFNPRGGNAVRDFNLTIMPGERVAFINEDGGTPTAIADMLMRFTVPDSGDITIDNQNIARVSLNSLRNSMALVAKQPGLFNRSVMENLRIGRPKARQDEIIDAVKKTGAHEFIAAKQEGFHTPVDDSFTASESRRLSLARALVKKAPIVIYEESENETGDNGQALDHLFENRTVLIFSTLPATLRKASRIVVLKDSAILRIGSYDEVMGGGTPPAAAPVPAPASAKKKKSPPSSAN